MTEQEPLFNELKAFELLKRQTDFGPRFPGSQGHKRLIEFIKTELEEFIDDSRTQPFEVKLENKIAACENIIGIIHGTGKIRKKILLGTHFDTRIIADREKDPLMKYLPIPGANDGASGTAILLEMAKVLSHNIPHNDIIFAFFDAEDVGDIDGYSFYEGSSYFSRNMGDFRPDEAIILDMVGGKNLCLDIDMNCLLHGTLYNPYILDIFKNIFAIAKENSYDQFYKMKKEKFKYIGCDHIPFLENMIPSYILIDIDYPQWHTLDDTQSNCSPSSLKAVGDVMLKYVTNKKEPDFL